MVKSYHTSLVKGLILPVFSRSEWQCVSYVAGVYRRMAVLGSDTLEGEYRMYFLSGAVRSIVVQFMEVGDYV